MKQVIILASNQELLLVVKMKMMITRRMNQLLLPWLVSLNGRQPRGIHVLCVCVCTFVLISRVGKVFSLHQIGSVQALAEPIHFQLRHKIS